ncbi:terminase small subunit [Acinetobacter sp. Ver3]|uniref:terminase small subunit n=1 Tax=Acinetobacter sp. Ver3 TaxID=466088 RepID=UPI00044DADA8|nr:terminase small subunit [Acinetobacter sp. Ver3]EZQ10751.1 hypothetical protein CL42_06355 [Acinetobacter sp. Ver3]
MTNEERELPAGAEPLENEKYELFCHEYLKDLNYARAGREVGIKNRQNVTPIFTRDDVQQRIAYLSSERIERTKIDADYVLRRLVEIDQMDVLDIMDDNYSFRPIGEWPLIWRQYVSNIENLEEFEGFGEDREQIGWIKKIKWPDKIKNLELLGKHVSVGAFKDKLEVDVNVDLMSELIDEISSEE